MHNVTMSANPLFDDTTRARATPKPPESSATTGSDQVAGLMATLESVEGQPLSEQVVTLSQAVQHLRATLSA